jgi:hypothetical protein
MFLENALFIKVLGCLAGGVVFICGLAVFIRGVFAGKRVANPPAAADGGIRLLRVAPDEPGTPEQGC